MPRPTPPKASPALDTGVFDIQAKVARAIGGSGGELTYGWSSGELVFTAHTGKKDSKKKPYTGIEDFCHSYKAKDFRFNFKIKSEKTEDNAKTLVGQMIPTWSATGLAATTAQPSTTVSWFTTTPTILTREADSHETRNWTQEQFVINNFMKEPSVGTEDEESNIV